MVWGAEESAPLEYFDDDRPQYHVQPPAGWMNDPNGPIYYKGRYHMYELISNIFGMMFNRRIVRLRGGPQQMMDVGVREGSGRGQLPVFLEEKSPELKIHSLLMPKFWLKG